MRPLYASLAAALMAAAALPAAAGTLRVPQQFSTIQSALNAAQPGDTVLVSAKPKGGVYNEAVTITTPSIVLQGRNNPIIDGTGLGVSVPNPSNPAFSTTTYPNGIEIRASHVAVRGLTVQNTGDGSYYDASSAINAGYLSPDYTTFYSFSDLEISGVTLRNDNAGITLLGQATAAADGTFTNPSGYRILGCTITGAAKDGANLAGVSNLVITGNQFTSNQQNGLVIGGGFAYPTTGALVVGNVFKNNTYDGVDANGFGLLVTANESAANGDYGILVNTAPFFFAPPAGATPAAPSYVTLNAVHNNALYGVYASGAQTISANFLSGNGGAGIYLGGADGSTISGNVITGTALAGEYDGDGTGIFAADSTAAYGADSGLKISSNQVSGNSGDGIYFANTAGGVVSSNSVTGNKGIGIHLSDYTYYNSYFGYAAVPTTVTQNRAVHNTLFDARDDASAPDNITDSNGEYFYGDGAATLNIWTKNQFGTTDPVGLSK